MSINADIQIRISTYACQVPNPASSSRPSKSFTIDSGSHIAPTSTDQQYSINLVCSSARPILCRGNMHFDGSRRSGHSNCQSSTRMLLALAFGTHLATGTMRRKQMANPQSRPVPLLSIEGPSEHLGALPRHWRRGRDIVYRRRRFCAYSSCWYRSLDDFVA
jgi:hypothetical protein